MTLVHRLYVVLPIVAALWISVAASPALAAGKEKFKFDEELIVDGVEFRLVLASSMSTKMLFITITISELGHYAPADYLARGVPEVELLTSDEIPKILVMRFLKKLELKQMQQLFEGIFDSAFERKSHKVAATDINSFLDLLRGAEIGTSIMLIRNPGGGLRVVYNGQPTGTVNSIGLCTALWGGLTN